MVGPKVRDELMQKLGMETGAPGRGRVGGWQLREGLGSGGACVLRLACPCAHPTAAPSLFPRRGWPGVGGCRPEGGHGASRGGGGSQGFPGCGRHPARGGRRGVACAVSCLPEADPWTREHAWGNLSEACSKCLPCSMKTRSCELVGTQAEERDAAGGVQHSDVIYCYLSLCCTVRRL